MHIELDYSVTVDDLHEYRRSRLKFATELPPMKKASAWRTFLTWGLILVAAIMVFVFRDEPALRALDVPIPANPINTVVILIPCLLILWFIVLIAWRAISKRPDREAVENDPNLAQPRHVTLADDGMTIQDPTSTSLMAWTHFIHFVVTENLFVLLVSRYGAVILPRRAFPSPAAIDEFRAFAQAHVGNTPIGFPVQPAASPPPPKDYHP